MTPYEALSQIGHANALKKRIDQICHETEGLSLTEFDALHSIQRNGPDAETMEAMFDLLTKEAIAQARILGRLESKGLILRRRNPQDGRYYLLSVSEKGEATCNRLLEQIGTFLQSEPVP